MSVAFDNVRLPENIEINAVGGPSFYTTVLSTQQGQEQRNQNWARQRMLYDIAYGVQEAADYEAVLAFFYARAGRARSFLFKDWTDYAALGQPLGTGDGTTTSFQLTRLYADAANQFSRRITRPVVGTIVVYVAGVAVTNWTLGTLGQITFATAPQAAAVLTADFEFDVPVRFDQDELQLTSPIAEVASIGAIKLKELME